MKLDSKDPIAVSLKDVMFVVEATSFEQHCLWEKYNTVVDWESVNSGHAYQIGTLDKRPVNLSMSFAKLNGQKVMFIEVVSQVADYQMVDDWLDANCAPRYDSNTRIARTNGMNFHHCLHEVARRSGIALDFSNK